MAAAFEHTVKIPSKYQNPYLPYDDMIRCVQLQLLPVLLTESNMTFFQTLSLAVQWEIKHLELKYILIGLNTCDVAEDIEFSRL